MCYVTTQTDIIIPNSSCGPYEHKLSSINFLLNRLHTCPITAEEKQTKIQTIKYILQRNPLEKVPLESQKHNAREDPKQQKTKWATFTYCGKEVRPITKIF
jgi:hypothetical protein